MTTTKLPSLHEVLFTPESWTGHGRREPALGSFGLSATSQRYFSLRTNQPPATSTFLSEQTSHQQPVNSTFLSEQISTSHQPPTNRTGCWCWRVTHAVRRPTTAPCSLALSATSQQYFSLRTNQPPTTSNQPALLFSQNKPAPATGQPNRLQQCRVVDGWW
jgi:hypothetical protein